MWTAYIHNQDSSFPTPKDEQISIDLSCGNCGELTSLNDYTHIHVPKYNDVTVAIQEAWHIMDKIENDDADKWQNEWEQYMPWMKDMI